MPKTTVAIFCTTEPDKVLPEIQGRCRRVRFNGVDPELVGVRIAEALKVADPTPFIMVAKEANGSFREAWSIVESLTLSGQPITEDLIYKAIGGISTADRNKMWTDLARTDIAAVAKRWKSWITSGAQPARAGSQLIDDLVFMASRDTTKLYWQKPLVILSGARLQGNTDIWLAALLTIAGQPYSLSVKEVDLTNLKGVKKFLYD